MVHKGRSFRPEKIERGEEGIAKKRSEAGELIAHEGAST